MAKKRMSVVEQELRRRQRKSVRQGFDLMEKGLAGIFMLPFYAIKWVLQLMWLAAVGIWKFICWIPKGITHAKSAKASIDEYRNNRDQQSSYDFEDDPYAAPSTTRRSSYDFEDDPYAAPSTTRRHAQQETRNTRSTNTTRNNNRGGSHFK